MVRSWSSFSHTDWSLPGRAFFTAWMCRDFLYLPGALFQAETKCADCWVIWRIHSGYHSKWLSWRQFLWPEPAHVNYTLTFENVNLIPEKMAGKSPDFCINYPIKPSSSPPRTSEGRSIVTNLKYRYFIVKRAVKYERATKKLTRLVKAYFL